jgi:ATP-binding cassette subfamily B protein/subfamily B ATP-binding cassette protein MsbA
MTDHAGLFGLCRWALGYAFGRWLALLGVGGAMLAQVGLDLLKPWPMVFLIDCVLRGSAPPPALQRVLNGLPWTETQMGLVGWSVGATFVLFLLGWAAQLGESYAQTGFGQRIASDLAVDLFDKLQRLSPIRLSGMSVGDTMRRVTTDSTCVATIVRDAILPMVSAVINLGAMLFILWRIDPGLTALALVVAPCMGLVFYCYARPMTECSYEQQQIEGAGYELVEQSFASMPVAQSFTREPENQRRLLENLRATLAATVALTKVQVRFKIWMGAATAVGTAGVLWFGARHAIEGRLSVGSIVLFLSYIVSLYTPLVSIMYTSSTVQSAGGSARRVMEIMNMPVDVQDGRGPVAGQQFHGKVSLERVTVGYVSDRPVLRDVSLEVAPGEIVALVGRTGAGKTTLASLIPRFMDPWQGRVLVDGVDVREMPVAALRRQIGIVPQEPFLFPMSIAANIAYGCPEASREQIETAAREANIHDFIARLPAGYDTVIGQRGLTVSGGERQRISIARALLIRPAILILDEPTSALDAQTEAALFETIERQAGRRTLILIAHRLSTVRHAAKIVVLGADGTVAEMGTHESLISRRGLYYSFLTRGSPESKLGA